MILDFKLIYIGLKIINIKFKIHFESTNKHQKVILNEENN